MNRIRVGVIGTGFMGPVHVEAVRRLGVAEVVAIAGSNQTSAERAAAMLGIPRAYGDYRRMLAEEDFEVVHNCAPTYLHFAINRDCLTARKHVLSEKPLAMTSAETSALLDMATRSGLKHAVCYNYRFYPMVQHLRSLVQMGALGEVRLIRGNYLQDWLSSVIDYNWRIEPQFGGLTRTVGDIGSHWLDTVQHITGQTVTAVFADLATLIPVRKKPVYLGATFRTAPAGEPPHTTEDVPVRSEDYGTLLLRFSGGAVGTVTVSQITPGRKNQLVCEIDGSLAAAAWNQEESERLWIGRRDGPNQVLLAEPTLLAGPAQAFVHYPGGHNQGWPDGVRNLMERFYADVLGEGSVSEYPTFADGHAVANVLDAVVESNQRRQWVDIPAPV